jgi:hypothetical protein
MHSKVPVRFGGGPLEKGCSTTNSTSLAAYPTSLGARKTDPLANTPRECAIFPIGLQCASMGEHYFTRRVCLTHAGDSQEALSGVLPGRLRLAEQSR